MYIRAKNCIEYLHRFPNSRDRFVSRKLDCKKKHKKLIESTHSLTLSNYVFRTYLPKKDNLRSKLPLFVIYRGKKFRKSCPVFTWMRRHPILYLLANLLLRVARFFLEHHTKTRKILLNNHNIYKMATKYTKLP
jgi:hypothetical protein